MKLPLMIAGVVIGLLVGGGAGSYWYLAEARTASSDEAPAEVPAFVDMQRKFVVPLVRGTRVRSLVVVDLRLEVPAGAQDRALALQPKVRDALLDALYALAVAGAFDGDLYSDNVQDEMRARLLAAARKVLQDDVSGILVSELLRQDQ